MMNDGPNNQTIRGCVLCKTRAAVDGHDHCPACLARVVEVLRVECRAWRRIDTQREYGAPKSVRATSTATDAINAMGET